MKKPLTMKVLAAAATLLLAAAGAHWATRGLTAEGKTTTATALFKVEGMTCGGCEAGVRMQVKKLDGVEEVEASHERKRARVTYDPKIVTPQRIVEAIEDLGYSAELLRDQNSAGTLY